jgi:hypothetical protein
VGNLARGTIYMRRTGATAEEARAFVASYKPQRREEPKPPPRPTTPDGTIPSAVERWNADHTGHGYPHQHGTCPVCGCKQCFGVKRDDATRWFCHNTDSHSVGKAHDEGGWFGDLLDIAVHQRGRTRVDVLRADGYLAAICGEKCKRSGKTCASTELYRDGKCIYHSASDEAQQARDGGGRGA